jgi:LysR family transcriptional regulator for metE and metH
MLDRHHLNIIREVDRLGSLTAAAKALFLTQPALSHTIKKLEQQIGTPVWMREGRALRLTQAGQFLLSVANRVLPQLENAQAVLEQYQRGQRGVLRIGMECHPCYQWLLKIVAPYLAAWPDVDLDVKQKFQFGGIGALFNYDIDMLVTPDPLPRQQLYFEPVFDYEQVLVVSSSHRWANLTEIAPQQLAEETLITYPVEIERLDIYNQFLLPAQCAPKKHKTIETTDILLQMVASGRGVTALPLWLATQYAQQLQLSTLRLGPRGISKQIFLGVRETDRGIDYLRSFVALARSNRPDGADGVATASTQSIATQSIAAPN